MLAIVWFRETITPTIVLAFVVILAGMGLIRLAIVAQNRNGILR
jgi:drug/metabolite transporter (DMT)-like permease